MFAALTRNAFGMRVIFIHLLKSRTKSLYLILKKNLKLNKVAILFVCLFVFLSKLGYVFTLRRISKKTLSMYFF